ncbi:ribosome maturation factor RimM [Kangiella profundi]|uniref:Ribosome maturation factor RimM n=1 Tax=Kangiella profundi TaxID=1561924 RepID=A0A2K9AWX8_9GAMM|nr:ribosome maturation factor RimM [Kangiella profundi]AUD78419.1 ribosome maturation factor RimM [Kangiella profundi]GGF07796.1 ribosome maturation factor RimM [Kangiella profundi]
MSEVFKPLIVGKLNGASGIKGWVKVYSYTDPKENILNYSPWYLKLDGQWQKVSIINGREQGKTVVAQLEGCNDRNTAESYRGVEIAIEESQLPQLEDGEYYWRDLIGLTVVNLAGEELGTVKKMMETGANDVLVVKTASKEELLIPYVPEYSVMKVDLDSKQITVDWELDYQS